MYGAASLRAKAKAEPSVFAFIAANQRLRRPGKGSGIRELGRIWYRLRQARSKSTR